MKKRRVKASYVIIVIFLLALALISILDALIFHVLNNYLIAAIYALAIFVFNQLLHKEKPRNRYVSTLATDVAIILMGAYLVYYLSGLFFGFYRYDNNYTLYSIVNFIIPITLMVVAREAFRYYIATKSSESKPLIIAGFIVFCLMDLAYGFNIGIFNTVYNTFIYLALYVLPVLAQNFCATFIALKSSHKINLIWMLTLELYVYLLPIVPKTNDYITAIIRFAFPMIIAIYAYNFFKKKEPKPLVKKLKEHKLLTYLPSALFGLIIIYFTSGFFLFQAIAIGSGSMSGTIEKGDVIIVEKIQENYDQIEIGTVIAYEKNGIIIVHRVIRVADTKDGEIIYYTKGDANESEDGWMVPQKSIVGTVKLKIPYIGIPTVWLNEAK